MNEDIPDINSSDDPEKVNSTSKHSLETNTSFSEDRRVAVISHLSMEAQLLITNAHLFRTRSAYTLWIGPYIILGIIIAGIDGNFPDIKLTAKSIPFLQWSAVAYWLIGLICGFIERHSWKQIRRLRDAIIELSIEINEKKQLIIITQDRQLEGTYHLPVVYGVVFFLILVPFIAIVWFLAPESASELGT